jgi:hypothetical protein
MVGSFFAAIITVTAFVTVRIGPGGQLTAIARDMQIV